MTNNDSSVV